jgi:hypothetical protein
MFPSNDSLTRRPLPSLGCPWGEFPEFVGTMRRSDVRTPFLPHFVFLRLAVPARVPVFAPTRPGTGRRPGVLWLATPSHTLRVGDVRTSQVPGEPFCAYALFFDPGRTAHIRPSRCVGMAPAMTTTRTPTMNHAFGAPSHGLGTRYLRFVLRTQDTLPVVGQTLRGGIDYPQGSIERFRECLLHSVPLSQALTWRNVKSCQEAIPSPVGDNGRRRAGQNPEGQAGQGVGRN